MTRSWPPAFLALAGAALFGAHALRAGLHLDDFGFHRSLARASWAQAWPLFRDYVPGRNLHVLYTWLLYRLLGPFPARLHAAGLLLDLALAPLVYALLRQRRHAPRFALIAAGLFLVWPNRGETHYWTSSIAMNLASTAFLLGAFLAAGSAGGASRRWPAAFLLYALALFDYDQVFFLWPLLIWHGARAKPRNESAAWPLAFAAGCAAMNACHLALRLFWPVAAGGRPVPRFGLFWENVAHELAITLVPLRKLPAWPSLAAPLGGPALTVLALALLSAAWLWLASRQQAGGSSSPREPLFGAAWLLLAYLPNDFWYLSPRHNLLPAVGAALLLAEAARRLSSAGRGVAAAAAALAWLGFGLGGAQALADGFGWEAGARLHAAFRAAAPALAPPDRPLFLLGAPSSAARGPAFEVPREAAWVYGQDRAEEPAGSVNALPTRTGFFADSDTEYGGPDRWSWTPYAGSSVLAFAAPDRFERAGTLIIRPVGEPAFEAPLGQGAAVPMEAPLWLLRSAPSASEARGGVEVVAGLRALNGTLRCKDAACELDLAWLSAAKRPDFAWTFALLDKDSRVVFEPTYRLRVGARLQTSMLWPVFDDLQPPSSWRPGRAQQERLRFSAQPGLRASAARVRVTVYERRADGPWPRLGSAELPLKIL